MEEPKCPMKEMSEISVDGNGNGNDSRIDVTTMRVSRNRIRSNSFSSTNTNDSEVGPAGPISSSPIRPIQRNKSGPQGSRMMMRGGGRPAPSRAPPKRSQSSKIGRPTFDPVLMTTDIAGAGAPVVNVVDQGKSRRGVNRSKSSSGKGTTTSSTMRNAHALPRRTGSFHGRRRVPDRASSSSSLRRGIGTNTKSSAGTVETDDVSVCDSVFTSMSIQTMDSIMIRKKQMPSSTTQGKDGGLGSGSARGGIAIEFDDSIHTIDYNDDDRPGPNGDIYEYEDELSVFSESWCSSEASYNEVLSDYEEGEMDGAILEADEFESSKSELTTTSTQLAEEKGNETCTTTE